jgi:hypothetical protein
MAKYFAVMSDRFITIDIETGQLEIYETESDATRNKPNNGKYQISEIEITRIKKDVDND